MRSVFWLVLGLIIATATFESSAHAQGSAVYLATYVDVMPNAVAQGAALLQRYRDASRKEDGNLRFDALQEIARPNRFAIVEAWRDKTALDTHEQTAATTQFRDKLKAIANAPYDQRVNGALFIGQGQNEDRAGAIYVVTHVDVIPPGKDDTVVSLKAMSADTAKDPGNITYEVLQQANRSNHFTVVEEWTTMKAADAHAMAEHTRAFRAKLMPVAGALYDERFYKALK
ncbi:MAG TPA: antibiotic biosynthesis monooxygenase [Xanthobacteraceae bacterium]|nr:antibiotic biosynthesis monooxygenase [Xanthobacteraceae bacterium]